jgi:hypothetical protein
MRRRRDGDTVVSMVRAVVLASIALACVACRPAAPAVPIGHSSSTSVAPAPPPRPHAPRSPSEALAVQHHAPVTIERSLSVPGGTVVVYAYDRLESKLGELAAEGRDVVAELEAEQSRCEDERAELDEDERDWVESEQRSCEELAAATLFDDEQLTSGCRAVGVASIDAQGKLLGRVPIQGSCLAGIASFEAYDLTQEPEDELLLVVTFESFGQLTRGGWGQTRETTSLHVLAGGAGAGEDGVAELLAVELEEHNEGGNCPNGVHRSVRVAAETIEVFSQAWNDCDRESCIDPTAEAAEDANPSEICHDEPVTAERARWQPGERAWGEFEPAQHDETVLPESTMK